MDEEFSNYAECCKTKNPSPDMTIKNRQTLPEIGMRIVNILEKSFRIQRASAEALGKTLDEPACPDMICLNDCLNYILTLTESNCEIAKIIHDSLI